MNRFNLQIGSFLLEHNVFKQNSPRDSWFTSSMCFCFFANIIVPLTVILGKNIFLLYCFLKKKKKKYDFSLSLSFKGQI